MSLVNWREWSDETFRDAQAQDKPILLDIGAVWCHWCHVMDDGIEGDPVHTGTYTHPEVAALIADGYIPVKVDTDRRPDINARYNMGGWPTTVFLTPTGEALYGETYVTPSRMLGLLKYVANYYRDNKEEIASRVAAHFDSEPESPGASADLPADASERVTAAILAGFDPKFGGFGTEPKFPHADALLFAAERVAQGDDRLRPVVATTLEGMAGGGMYDPFAGGFFRYSTTRDWRIPHYEKMLEDNAQLATVCFEAAIALDDDHFREIGYDVHKWLFDVMRDENGCFAGSQDADKEEHYYGKPLAERALLPTPYIDRTVYLNWNAYMVTSLVTRYKLFGDIAALDAAKTTYRFIAHHIAPHHYSAGNATGGPKHLLTDLTALCEASLAIHEATGDQAYLTEATTWATTITERLSAIGGGFCDAPTVPGAIGALATPKIDLRENSDAAYVLIRTARATTAPTPANATPSVITPNFIEAARNALSLFATEYARAGLFGAAYARAIAELAAPDITVVIVGAGDQANTLATAAWQTLRPGVRVVKQTHNNEPMTTNHNATHHPGTEYPGTEYPATQYPAAKDGSALAYVCIGTHCHAPTANPAELTRLIREPN